MDWWWVVSCLNRGQRWLRFQKRRTPSPKLMCLRRPLDEKPTSERVPGLLDTQAPRKPERKRQTVYLYPDLYKWIRHYATDTDQEISDVVNEALKQYKAAQETVNTEQ